MIKPRPDSWALAYRVLYDNSGDEVGEEVFMNGPDFESDGDDDLIDDRDFEKAFYELDPVIQEEATALLSKKDPEVAAYVAIERQLKS